MIRIFPFFIIPARFVLLASLLLWFSAAASTDRAFAQSDSASKSAPGEDSLPVCIGYNPLHKDFTWKFDIYSGWLHCPPNYAIYGVGKPYLNTDFYVSSTPINCCPLPAQDILTDEHLLAVFECPPGYVITGLLRQGSVLRDKIGVQKQLRCTRINLKKYSLGPVKGGTLYGISSSAAFPWNEERKIRRDEVPVALRFGISRYSYAYFLETGCVGNPIGGLFVGKRQNSCAGTLWRELLYRKQKPEDSNVKSVKMFPQCKGLTSVFSPNAKCIKK